MAIDEIHEEHITYEARLGSFHKNSKKRGSTASGRSAKPLNWPHKNLAPKSLAKAGFFYNPSAESPDNVTCFLCRRSIDGWEASDDPLVEHLKWSPECGWAITTAIELEVGDYAQQDPNQPQMKDARKATFAGRWPHEGKKGWKCKTKQLVDAGWRYTPTEDYDDMATCSYCALALDGWEPSDKPLDEHYNRSPECAFFLLLEESQAAKKSSRSKAGRASKASRLSTQSIATVASEVPSISEITAGPEESVLTNTSTMTQTTKKGKTKKATTGKGRKTKAKKEDPVETDQVDELAETEDTAPPAKPKRGKKRDSTALDDSMDTTSEIPAAKKRATRMASGAVNNSTMETDDTEMLEASAPKKMTRKKARAKTTRKTSTTSVASAASVASVKGPPGTFPDDDEIERQLEEDLRRPLSEDEEVTVDSDSERLKAKAKKSKGAKASRTQKVTATESPEFAMLDPSPVDVDDAEVDDELEALQAEMEMDEPVAVPEQELEVEAEVEAQLVAEAEAEPEAEPEPEPKPEPVQELHVPKKGRKAGTRKASKQTKSKKNKAATPPIEQEEIATHEPEPETDHLPTAPEPEAEVSMHDESLASTGTVVINKAAGQTKRGRGRPSKASLLSQEPSEVMELVEPSAEAPAEAPANLPVKRGRGRPSKASLASQAAAEPEETKSAEAAPVKRGRGRPKKSVENQKPVEPIEPEEPQPTLQPSNEDVHVYSAEASEAPEEHAPVVSFEEPAQSTPLREPVSPEAAGSATHLANPPSTPGRIISPAPSARQAAISPSQSPQSSNAENEPPSSRPPVSTTKRVILAPVAATPMRGSPSKRNIIAGLRSTTPWTALDIETVLGSPSSSPNKENGVERFLNKAQNLSSPEKQMTVEEWILFNAAEAEKKLKHECEVMVSKFESEGTKAMSVLEGLVVD